jgi:thiamine biosynthesis lipoprotein
MASPCEVLLDSASETTARPVVEAVAAEAWRIEDKFSRFRDDNIVHRINTSAGEPVEVDEETARLLDFATALHGLSDGRFDITSGALHEVWVFDGSDRIPEPDAVVAVLDRVGWGRVDWRSPVLALGKGMAIDLGGIGKEYAVDRCVAVLAAATGAPGLVNFGGDLAVTGPPASRSAWKVGVEGPWADSPDRLLDLRQGGLATSGDARRFLLRGGIRYSHILDPATGWPVGDAPHSITVAADTCTQAGMLSTLAILKGPEAEAFLEAQGVRFWCRR